MKYILITCFLALGYACGSGQRESYAHITQRRADSGGKVMILYRFHAGGGEVSDSMEVGREIVVPHDSVKVVYPSENPS